MVNKEQLLSSLSTLQPLLWLPLSTLPLCLRISQNAPGSSKHRDNSWQHQGLQSCAHNQDLLRSFSAYVSHHTLALLATPPIQGNLHGNHLEITLVFTSQQLAWLTSHTLLPVLSVLPTPGRLRSQQERQPSWRGCGHKGQTLMTVIQVIIQKYYTIP